MAQVQLLPPFRLELWEGVFPVCSESLALGSFATVHPGNRVCDLGTGSGLLLLLLARRARGLHLLGVELEEGSARCAQSNLRENGLNGEVVQGDLRHMTQLPRQLDLVLSNPPYFSLGSGTSAGGARSEENCTLQELCAAAGRLLKHKGRFALCHRPERLAELFECMRCHGIEPKRMKLLSHTPQKSPYAVLVEGMKQGKPGLKILPWDMETGL